MRALALRANRACVFIFLPESETFTFSESVTVTMNFFELFLLAAGLSADAFAASVCKGLYSGGSLKAALSAGLWFGGFQALMPMAGWLFGSRFHKYIYGFDHWIIFALLLAIGGGMIRGAFSKKNKSPACDSGCDPAVTGMLPLAVATSLDALAVGVTFPSMGAPVVSSSLFIGCVTFVFSAAGVKIGGIFGDRYEKPAVISGGVILVSLGIKTLLDHLGVISF